MGVTGSGAQWRENRSADNDKQLYSLLIYGDYEERGNMPVLGAGLCI